MPGDFCTVCANTLKWVAYGPCGHKDGCSTCVARLRFSCNDFCCCTCKAQSDVVFVTKALGDNTHTINDFSTFHPNPKEVRVGQYWYNEDMRAFFDDEDQYMTIKAMCKLFKCELCQSHFGGDSALYDHLTKEHYTCRICQRHLPVGRYEFYKDFDDLKSHNDVIHRGHVLRSKRSTALEVPPISFRFQRDTLLSGSSSSSIAPISYKSRGTNVAELAAMSLTENKVFGPEWVRDLNHWVAKSCNT